MTRNLNAVAVALVELVRVPPDLRMANGELADAVHRREAQYLKTFCVDYFTSTTLPDNPLRARILDAFYAALR